MLEQVAVTFTAAISDRIEANQGAGVCLSPLFGTGCTYHLISSAWRDVLSENYLSKAYVICPSHVKKGRWLNMEVWFSLLPENNRFSWRVCNGPVIIFGVP